MSSTMPRRIVEAFDLTIKYRPEKEPTHEELEQKRAEIVMMFQDFVRKNFPPGMIDVDLVNRVSMETREAFHIRDTHWVPVPSSGQCPTTHPSKLTFPGTDTLRCFTPAAARVVRGMRSSQVIEALEAEHAEKLTNERARLRQKLEDNPTERCGDCVFFTEPDGCKIVVGPVAEDLVCDWIQSRGTEAAQFEIADEDWLSFVRGMAKEQPYSHIVIDGALTPEGPVVLIEDTAKPPHRFSLSKEFHVEHSSLEHHWTQAEVDRLVAIGARESKRDQAITEQERAPTTVQTLIFSKEKFETEASAKKWAKDHDFKFGKVDETESSFRLRQRDPGDFRPRLLRTIDLADGVKAVIGRLKESVTDLHEQALDAIILDMPHGEMISRGEKTMILKGRKLNLPSPALIVTDDQAFGVVELEEAIELPIQEFGIHASEHRVSDEERRRNWPDARVLWAYQVKTFQRFDTPRAFERDLDAPVAQKSVVVQENRETHTIPFDGQSDSVSVESISFTGTGVFHSFSDMARNAVKK